MGSLSSALGGVADTGSNSAPEDPRPASPLPSAGATPGISSGAQFPDTPTDMSVTQPGDLPRMQRTMSRLHGALLGFLQGGVPGAVFGAVDPQAIEQARNNQRAITQAKVTEAQANATFATARAGHEVAMALRDDAEYQALPEKLQQEQQKRGFDTLKSAKEAGYLPIASVPLDQGKDQNSQSAMAALQDIKNRYGLFLEGLIYVHTGSSVTVLKLSDPNAALSTINQMRAAQGMRALNPNEFGALSPKAKEDFAQEAINFTSPADSHGVISQQSLNTANMRLLTVKAQPEFNGKAAMVSQLQQTIDHQQAVLDSGAKQEGARKGVEAIAEQPGKTAAKVAEIRGTAGPEASAAAMKAGAVRKAENLADLDSMRGNADAFGNQVGVTPEGQSLSLKEYNSRADKFSKEYVQPLNVLAKTTMEFNRINSNPNQTGAEKVTALLNAVGISGDPLKGKGFKITNDVINEHATSRNIWEGYVQKLNTVTGSGGPITSQQIADYTAVAHGVVHDAYVTAAKEAQRQGLPVNFLPQATQAGQSADHFTAKIYLDAAGGNVAKAHKAMVAAGWAQ